MEAEAEAEADAEAVAETAAGAYSQLWTCPRDGRCLDARDGRCLDARPPWGGSSAGIVDALASSSLGLPTVWRSEALHGKLQLERPDLLNMFLASSQRR